MKIILCGFGVVAQSLVKLFESRDEELYAKYGLKPRLVAVFDSKGSAVEQSGLKLNELIKIIIIQNLLLHYLMQWDLVF